MPHIHDYFHGCSLNETNLSNYSKYVAITPTTSMSTETIMISYIIRVVLIVHLNVLIFPVFPFPLMSNSR